MTSTLWRDVESAREHALAVGALGPIETEHHVLEECGARFVVRVVSSLAAKERAARARPSGDDPFLPYDRDLYVRDAGRDHVLLLNKFPVVDDHVLLVTRAFEPQDVPASREDFVALFGAMHGVEALAFYNAGAVAGASQAHKHLQLVPLPLDEGPGAVPLEAAIRAGALPFAHALDARPRDASDAHARYLALLDALGVSDRAHNLLMTPAWMLVVPRVHERFESISVNALGFAGSLLVRDRAQLERVREVGPLAVLRHVAGDR